MRLAFRFGRHDVDRFMRQLGSRQLVEWVKFLEMEAKPPPPRIVSPADFRANYAKRVQKQRG